MKKPLATSIAALLLIAHHAHGLDATWLSGGATPTEWTESDNWIPATVPTGTATFTNNGAGTNVFASGQVTIGAITFTAAPNNAPAYTIEFDDFLTVNGVGVTNNSTNTQIINLSGNGTTFSTFASASAGTTAVTYNNGFTFNFNDSSTAGNAIINNNSSLAFNINSSAGTAQITNNATLDFFDSSTAGNATITNSATEVITFHSNSTAATSTITNNGALNFNDSSTAASASITNNSGSTLLFSNSSTAATATIINNGPVGTVTTGLDSSGNVIDLATSNPVSVGVTTFSDTTTAGSAQITNNHGGETIFQSGATAGTAQITNNTGGITLFQGSSTAANATITNNAASYVIFSGNATATNATTITNNLGGILDISTLTNGGISIGQVNGAGNIYLGANNLTIGGGNADSTISGVISDGAAPNNNYALPGNLTGGSLTKIGTGTLTLTGANTFTGATTIMAGAVQFAMGSSITGPSLAGPVNLAGSTAQLILPVQSQGLYGQYFNLDTPGNPFSNMPNPANFASLSALQSHVSTLTPAVVANSSLAGTNFFFGNGTSIPQGVNFPAPYNGGLSIDFEAVYSGAVNITTAGTYTFATSSDDGSVLYIDGNLVVNNNMFQGQFERTGTVTLTAGIHDIVIGYYEGGGGYGLFANYIPPGGTEIPLPNSMLLTVPPISIGSLTGVAGSQVILNGSELLVNQAADGTFAGTISDGSVAGGSLVKSGSATLTLSGANTYTGGTEVSAGTLQLGDGTTTGATVGTGPVLVDSGATFALNLANGEVFSGALTDNGTVVASSLVAGTNNYTIASNIGGTGGFTMNGTNVVTLTGTNSYSGNTTINSGTLVVNGTAGSGTTIVNSGGTLAGTGTVGAVTLNGTVAPGPVGGIGTLNTGPVTWNGGGTLSLQLGANGAASLLAVNGALTKGTLGTYTINLVDGGINQTAYTLATYGSTTFLASDFTLTLPTFYAGVLAVTGTEMDLLLSFSGGGSIIDNAPPIGTPTFANFIVNGSVITAGGNNTIQTLSFTPGSSLQIFNTLYVTQGPVILVNGATLTLNGNLSTSELELLYGSLLKGNGTIFGDVVNGGVISPGNSPGIIRMSGNLTETPTGTLQMQIGGKDISHHDLLAVGGTATLGGTLQLQQLNDFKLHRNDSITFLTADGGINGRFATVENGFARTTILEPTVVYSQNSVALEAQQGSFKQFAASENLTPNQQAVGGMLDSAVNDHRANTLIDYMDGRILSKLPGDLEKISPDSLTSVFTIGTALATVQSQNLQRRTDDIRSGSSGFNAANLAINGDGPSFSGRFSMEPGWAGPNGNDGKDMTANKEVQPVAPAENRWGAFLSGTGDWVSVGDTNNARGYNLESGGFTLGVDYKVCPNFAIGLMAGYTGTTSDLANNGRVYVNGGKLGMYATTFVGGWYADVAAFGGYDSYDTRRSALQGDAHGSTEGGNVDAMIGTGYDFKAGALTFGPTATFNYTYVGTSEFNESGSLAPLDIHGGRSDSLRTAFGMKASYDWKVGGVVIKPELRAAWQHEYGDTAYALDSSLASGAGSTFTVNGPKLGRDSLLLGAGFAIQCSERCSTYFYYDGELGRTNYESNAVTGGIRITY